MTSNQSAETLCDAKEGGAARVRNYCFAASSPSIVEAATVRREDTVWAADYTAHAMSLNEPAETLCDAREGIAASARSTSLEGIKTHERIKSPSFINRSMFLASLLRSA